MSSFQIARKDVEDVVRSRMLWSILALFLVLMAIVTFGTDFDRFGDVTDLGAVINLFMTLAGEFVLPATALIVGYMAIVGERQSGSLRILFGLSHDRRDVFVGKLASRTAVMAFVTLFACGTVGVLVFVRAGPFSPVTFVQFLGLTLLTVLAFASIAVSVSAIARSRMQSVGGVAGCFVLFTFLWHPIVAGTHYVLEGELVGVDIPDWYGFLLVCNPLYAYRHAIGSITDQYIWALVGWPSIVEDYSNEAIQQRTLLLEDRVAGEPFFISELFAVVVLLAWIAVPVAIGYWRFQRADLN